MENQLKKKKIMTKPMQAKIIDFEVYSKAWEKNMLNSYVIT